MLVMAPHTALADNTRNSYEFRHQDANFRPLYKRPFSCVITAEYATD
jgi:hypothetical protein